MLSVTGDHSPSLGISVCWVITLSVISDHSDSFWWLGVLCRVDMRESEETKTDKGDVTESGKTKRVFVCWLVGCLTSQQQASASQGRICSDNLTCCHTEIEAADPTFYLTQSQYTDTGPTSPSADPITGSGRLAL